MPDAYGLAKWLCTASRAPEFPGRCDTYNLAIDSHCTVCLNAKPRSIRQAFPERRAVSADLEELLTRAFAKNRAELGARIEMVNGQVFLLLASVAGDPAVYAVEGNHLTPCDNFGRRGW